MPLCITGWRLRGQTRVFAELKYDHIRYEHDAPGTREKPQTQIMRLCLSYVFKTQYTEANKAKQSNSRSHFLPLLFSSPDCVQMCLWRVLALSNSSLLMEKNNVFRWRQLTQGQPSKNKELLDRKWQNSFENSYTTPTADCLAAASVQCGILNSYMCCDLKIGSRHLQYEVAEQWRGSGSWCDDKKTLKSECQGSSPSSASHQQQQQPQS